MNKRWTINVNYFLVCILECCFLNICGYKKCLKIMIIISHGNNKLSFSFGLDFLAS